MSVWGGVGADGTLRGAESPAAPLSSRPPRRLEIFFLCCVSRVAGTALPAPGGPAHEELLLAHASAAPGGKRAGTKPPSLRHASPHHMPTRLIAGLVTGSFDPPSLWVGNSVALRHALRYISFVALPMLLCAIGDDTQRLQHRLPPLCVMRACHH